MADHYTIRCGHCGDAVGANIVTSTPSNMRPAVYWLLCPLCGDGSVVTKSGAVYPPAPAGAAIPNLPSDVDGAWREVRTAHAVAAYTAAEIMCRKILMHLAVDKANSQTGKTFVHYIDDLDGAGYVAPGMKPVIDSIRSRGNIANHDLPASTEQESLMTLRITEHLLRTIYELPGLVAP